MRLESSGKTASFERRQHIKKGYYTGELISAKPRQKQDGTPIEGQYGKQIVCMFKVLDEQGNAVQITTKNSEGGSLTVPVELPMVLNSEYKQKDGTYRTAVTPNSLITKVFQNLGWKFTEDGFDTDEFVGKKCELNIDDYDAKETKQDDNGNDVMTTYKASGIKDVNKLEEKTTEKEVESKGGAEQPSTTTLPPPDHRQTTVKQEEETAEQLIQKRMDNLTELHKNGMVTTAGYRKAMEEMERMQRCQPK